MINKQVPEQWMHTHATEVAIVMQMTTAKNERGNTLWVDYKNRKQRTLQSDYTRPFQEFVSFVSMLTRVENK